MVSVCLIVRYFFSVVRISPWKVALAVPETVIFFSQIGFGIRDGFYLMVRIGLTMFVISAQKSDTDRQP